MDTAAVVIVVVVVLLVLLGIALYFLLRPSQRPAQPIVEPERHPSSFTLTPPSGSFDAGALQAGAVPPAGGPRGAPGFVLTAVSGSRKGQSFPLTPAGLRIGRNPENTVVLDEPMVSRQHAQVVLQEATPGAASRWVLLDRNSINGTYVDGLRTYEKILEPGNRINIGVSEFVFHRAGTPVPIASPVKQAPAGLVVPPIPVSRSLDSYQIEGLIGDGGMATVHRARASDGHVVAIKIPKITDDSYLVRKFENEGNKIAALTRGHPNIVQIECFGYQRDGVPYIVMEYVDGGSLREKLRQQLSPDEIRRIVGETCLALGWAHQHNLVHRDIKPENILLTRQGQVKVADFGIAKDLSGVTVTHKGPVGTPEYMSPEQALGEDIQPASDIYAVGIVVYEMLTGQVPFPRRSTIMDDVQQALDVVDRHIKENPRSPDQVRPGVPRDLAAFAMKALNKEPGKRFPNGHAAAAALGFKDQPRPSTPNPAGPAPITTGRLVVVLGPQRGKPIPLPGEVVTVGRAEIDPTSQQISRRHFIVRRRGPDFYLEDVSMNGTWINNTRVSGEVMISAGDHIRTGDSLLRLEI